MGAELTLDQVDPSVCWPIARLIIERIATRRDLETCYSFEDVIEENKALDAWQRAQREQERRAAEKRAEEKGHR